MTFNDQLMIYLGRKDTSFSADITGFNNSGTISANTTLNTTVSSTANNSFTNTGGVLSADTVSLSVAGDFDYVAEYLNNGTIYCCNTKHP